MRKIFGLIFVLFSFSICGEAFAQVQTEQSKDTPKNDTPETTQPQNGDKATGKADSEINLDEFFRKGEENAKNGASCDKPAEPVNPIA